VRGRFTFGYCAAADAIADSNASRPRWFESCTAVSKSSGDKLAHSGPSWLFPAAIASVHAAI